MKLLSKFFLIFLCCCTFNIYGSDSIDNLKAIRSNVKWKKLPQVNISDKDLQGYDRNIVVLAVANERGTITCAKVIESSGIEKLDRKAIKAIKKASFYPYQENGIYYPIRFEQPFNFQLSREPKFKIFPKIMVNKSIIKGKTRHISIYSEADSHGSLTLVKIKNSSGLPELDQYVLDEFCKKAQFYPLIVNGTPYPIRDVSEYIFSDELNTFD